MKEKKSKRLKLVYDLALAAERQAARNLGEAQKALISEQKRLNDIKDYYKNYQERFDRNTQNIRGSDLANSRAFLSNLDQACQAQIYHIRSSEQRVAIAREQWRKSHLKSDALESYIQNAASSEQKIEDQKEQKFLDDLMSQRPSN